MTAEAQPAHEQVLDAAALAEGEKELSETGLPDELVEMLVEGEEEDLEAQVAQMRENGASEDEITAFKAQQNKDFGPPQA